jgi:hypothetical protein
MATLNQALLLREICAAKGRVITTGNSPRHDELVKLGFLESTALNISDVLYEVTNLGRQVAEIPLHPDSIRPSQTN